MAYSKRLNNSEKSDPKKILLLWCSPGFGVVDIWLPIIRKLKEKDCIKIDFIFPDPSALRLEDKKSNLFSLTKHFSDRIIYKGYSGRWFVAPTLDLAHAENKLCGFDERILRLSRRLTKGKASRFFFLRMIGRFTSIVSKYILYLKENFRHQCLYNFDLLRNVDGILCDITVESKLANIELRSNFKYVQKFSMFHAMGALWVAPQFICEQPIEKRLDTIVYSMSDLEINGYEKCFGILKENIVHAGIPRQDKDWIDFICNQPYPNKDNLFDSFVFIIGRPASAIIPVERKRKALRDIYDIVCTKYKLKLVIKTHPKESLDEHIYREGLGLKNYGKTWMYSDSHPFILGKESLFSIAFFSGVAVDMLAINKPTIEYLDLSGLTLYDNRDSLRDKHKNPVFQYRYVNLVLGASSKLELEQHVESILNEYKATISPLNLRYENYFKTFDGSSEMVANDIFKRIGG